MQPREKRHKVAKTPSDNTMTYVSKELNGDCLKWNANLAMSAMKNAALNIHHGNTALIVV